MNAVLEPIDTVKTADAVAMTVERIIKCLPHRYPYLLVDRIDGFEPGRWISGVKNVASYEPMLVPQGAARYPVGLVVESIGQIAIALFNLSRSDQAPPEILLGAINDVSVMRSIPMGCCLQLYAEVGKELDNGFIFSGHASINGEIVLTLGSLIAMEKPNNF